VTDSIISDNGGASGGAGILIQPQTDGSARVELNRVVVENNTHGIFANGTGNGGTNTIGRIAVQIRDSAVTGSAFNGISAYTAAGQLTTVITVDRSSSNLSGQAGILAQGSPAFVVLGNATVMSNGTGLSSVNGGNILSYQNNQLTGNNTDGAPTGVLTMK
jgi:hypothetical protein